MKSTWKKCLLFLLLVMVGTMAQPITVSSAPFTFPPFSGIKLTKHPLLSPFMQFSGYSSNSGIVTFRWSFPPQPVGTKGTIAIYSLRGQCIRTFSIAAQAGSVKWNSSREGTGGVTIARLSYGSCTQHIKLVLCR